MPSVPAGRSLLAALLAATPLPLAADTTQPDAALVALGRSLFNDTSLSGAGMHSCATCHPVALGLEAHTTNHSYVGLEVVADGSEGARSTPTLWGAGLRTQWGWAGLPTIEQNIRGIIVNRMKGPEPTEQQLAALAAYILSLPLPPTPHVDDAGRPVADAPEAVRRGHALFETAGCAACHMEPGLESTAKFDVAGREVKVPSLWAVQHTGPWFHDGRHATLDAAVRAMWAYQAGRIDLPATPTDAEVADLVAYLEAL